MSQAYLSDARYTERLQISLSPELKMLAEKLSGLRKMSLAELFRYLLLVEAGEVKRVEVGYDKVIENASGSVLDENHPEWKGVSSVNKWLKVSRQNFERKA
ncbi:MAG: hypothetical protein ABIJ43_03315 [Candidatus Beckwithbacteria bacterium]